MQVLNKQLAHRVIGKSNKITHVKVISAGLGTRKALYTCWLCVGWVFHIWCPNPNSPGPWKSAFSQVRNQGPPAIIKNQRWPRAMGFMTSGSYSMSLFLSWVFWEHEGLLTHSQDFITLITVIFPTIDTDEIGSSGERRVNGQEKMSNVRLSQGKRWGLRLTKPRVHSWQWQSKCVSEINGVMQGQR